MESWLAISTLQHWQHLGDFQNTSRPAVNEQKWNGSLDVALLMYEMHVNRAMTIHIDLNLVVRKGVQFGFVSSPVEFGTPVLGDALDVLSGIVVSFEYPHALLEAYKGAP